MLQVIRERAQGLIAWLIVGAIVLSFALWGINDYLTDDDSGFNAATVNGVDVSLYEYQVAYQNERARLQQMFGERFDSDLFDDQIKKTALERVIDNELLTQFASELGFRVSDAQLAGRLHGIEAFQQDGRFSKALYEQQVQASGESTAGFEYRMRRALLADQVILGVAGTDFATKAEVDEVARLSKQQRELAYVRIDQAKFAADLQFDDAEIEQFYRDNSDRFKTEEQVSLQYVELSVDQLAKDIEVTEDELREYYEEQKDRFVTPEERRARHILIQIDDDTDADAARQRIEELRQRIDQGEDFAALAKQYSEDPGSAPEGGDLGFFARGIMDPEFEDMAFALEVGEVSQPVRTQFGYHLIKLEAVRGGEGKSFAEVREQLASELKRKKAERIYFDKVEQLANLAYEIPDSLEPVAEELGLRIESTPLFGRSGGPGIAANRKVVDAAFSDDVLIEGLNSEAIELGRGRSVVVRKLSHQPAALRPLDEVREQVIALLRQQKAREGAEQAGKKLVEEIRQGKDPEQLAEQAGYQWQAPRWVSRDSREVDAEILRRAFSVPAPQQAPSVVGASLGNGDFVVLQVSAVRDGEISDDERQGIARNLASIHGLESFSALLKTLRERAEIQRYPGNL